MTDNQFLTPAAGEADWDASLSADLVVLERGYHVTERAGVAINTGQVLWLNSGGFFFQFDPNSASVYPMAMAFTAAASGDTLRALAWGIVRSLGINSPAVPGLPLYVSASTPGVIVGSYAGADRQIGWGLTGYGVLFNPSKIRPRLAALLDVSTNGVADGKVLQWADASSKWVPATAAAGGGVTVGTWPSVVQTFVSSTTAGSLGMSFASTPTVGNVLMFVTISNRMLNVGAQMGNEAWGEQDYGRGLSDGAIGVHYLLADGTKTFGFGNFDGDFMSVYGAEIQNWGRIEVKHSRQCQAPNTASGAQVTGPPASSVWGKALAFSVVTDRFDISSSTIAAGNAAWTLEKAFVGGTFGGHGCIAKANSPIGANSFSLPTWTLAQSASAGTGDPKGLTTILIHPKVT